jgi:hypothetical protein
VGYISALISFQSIECQQMAIVYTVMQTGKKLTVIYSGLVDTSARYLFRLELS